MAVLPWIFSSGWASGINGYAVVLILGLLGRYAGVDGIPPTLERTDVLLAAAVLTAADLIVDKIPYLDSLWDAVHTVIRPAIGAAVGALIAGHAGDLGQAVGAATGGLTALASHSVKAALRAAVNTSPEPVSNIVLSSAEDLTMAAVVALSVRWPWIAAGIAAVLLGSGLTVAVLLISRIRRFLAARRERRRPPAGSDLATPSVGWRTRPPGAPQ